MINTLGCPETSVWHLEEDMPSCFDFAIKFPSCRESQNYHHTGKPSSVCQHLPTTSHGIHAESLHLHKKQRETSSPTRSHTETPRHTQVYFVSKLPAPDIKARPIPPMSPDIPKHFLLPYLKHHTQTQIPPDPQRLTPTTPNLRPRPPLLLHHHIGAPRTVPSPVGLALEPHAAPVEPLVRTLVIVAGDHVAETHVLT